MIGWLDTAARYAARAGGLAILASAVLISLDVLFRNLGVGMQLHAFDLTNYAFAAAVAFAFGAGVTSRSNIRIDVAYQQMPLTVKAVLDLTAQLLLAALATGMAWHAWRVVAHSLKLGARPNSTLDIPLALPQAIWAGGLSFFALVCVALAARGLGQMARGRLAQLHREAGPPSHDPDGEAR